MSLEIPTQDDICRVMNGDAPATKSVIGVVHDPAAYFEQQKLEMFAKLGDTSTVRVLTNRIWVAIWMRPESKKIVRDDGTVADWYHTDTTRDEDIYQGNAGLIVAMGELAYVPDGECYFGEHVPKVGDWVLYHRGGGGYGVRFRHNGVECVMLEQEKAIKAILTRPDLVE